MMAINTGAKASWLTIWPFEEASGESVDRQDKKVLYREENADRG